MSASEDGGQGLSQPGSFGKKLSRSSHTHNAQCSHKYVVPAKDLNDRGACAAAQLLHAIPASLERFDGKGTLPTAVQQAKVTVSQVLMPKAMATGEVTGLDSAMGDLLLTPRSFVKFSVDKRGGKTNETMNSELIAGDDTRRAVRSDKYDRRVPYNYFHHLGDGPDFCSLVEPDKSKRNAWKGKEFVLGDESLILQCQPACRRGTCATLCEDYRRSETAHKYERENPGKSIADHQLSKCLCPCIKPEKIADCACPDCADFTCLVRALREVIGCESCKDGIWVKALSSTSALAKSVSCDDECIPEMERAGSDDQFFMRPLRCCVADGEVTGITPCAQCRVSDRLPNGDCPCFSAKSLDGEVEWLTRQDTIEGKNHDQVVERLRSHTGKLSELLSSIREKAKPYLYHLWRARFIRRCFHLDCDFFEPLVEAVLLADFASAMVLGGGYKATCETDATCNLYVVLVLYKVLALDGSWETKCDYVRFWSPASTSAEFHHHAMRIVMSYLKESGKVPNLKRLSVWTDGHPSTYKGFPNFGRMGYWPLHKPVVDGKTPTLSLNFDLSKPLGLRLDEQLIVRSFEGQAELLQHEATGGGSAATATFLPAPVAPSPASNDAVAEVVAPPPPCCCLFFSCS